MGGVVKWAGTGHLGAGHPDLHGHFAGSVRGSVDGLAGTPNLTGCLQEGQGYYRLLHCDWRSAPHHARVTGNNCQSRSSLSKAILL